uniref:Semaphorin 4A n=1 Tax=Laticauda laticaudata TaxID=8630 RepID=A0A8C5SS05_LATLA
MPSVRNSVGREVGAFSQEGILNYDTFLLSADGETLYVGGRDAILALNISSAPIRLKGKIPWSPSPEKRRECVFKKKSNETECFNFIRILVQLNKTHLYTCGTYAFSPTCAYIVRQPLLQEGKGLCPFDPRHKGLQGGPISCSAFSPPPPRGDRTVLKTDGFLSWLHDDAVFVASFNVPGPPEEEKIYFFFEETAKEFDFFEKLTVSRVARVCKNDVGGDKVLQKKWTTFLKAHLSCSQAGLFPHTVLQHVFALPQPGGSFLFYGVFASQWQTGSSGSSAVCAFSLDAIEKAFAGKFKELNKDCSRWMTYSGPAMDPRPGSCSVGPSSDKALTFMKDHFLMDEKVAPIHNKPLLVKEDVKYTRIVVHQAQAACGAACAILFLGTDRGSLHKAVVVGRKAHIIEEVQLFERPEPVQNLLLVPEKVSLGWAFIISRGGGVINRGERDLCQDPLFWPKSSSEGLDALCGAAVEGHQQFFIQMLFPEKPQVIESLLGPFDQRCNVGTQVSSSFRVTPRNLKLATCSPRSPLKSKAGGLIYAFHIVHYQSYWCGGPSYCLHIMKTTSW